jgi:hypothetical protein
LHSRAIPSVDLTSKTKEKTSSPDNNSKNNQDPSSQGDESLNPDKQPDSTLKPSDDPAIASDDSKNIASDDPDNSKKKNSVRHFLDTIAIGWLGWKGSLSADFGEQAGCFPAVVR